MSVDALFVDKSGPYPALLGERVWDERRDARTYDGQGPVIAHPPCNVWCAMARLNERRYGIKVGSDGGCFASALMDVSRVGGVLEHPAFSLAWDAHELEKPSGVGWRECDGYWVCEVWQSAYGHRARKRTWLLYVGMARPFELRWERPSGTHQVGWFDRNKPTLSKRESKATPPMFAQELIRLANWSLNVGGAHELAQEQNPAPSGAT